MSGLAIGSYLFGRLSDRLKNPLYIYLFIELGLLLYALSFQSLFDVTRNIYVNHFARVDPSLMPPQLIKFLQSFLLLIIPTTLMGGTIPVVTTIIVNNLSKLGKKLSLIYALNNFGAAAGGFVTGFFLIRLLGMRETLYLAAGLNLLNAILIFLVRKQGRRTKESSHQEENREKSIKWPTKYIRLILIVFALEGFTTLAYEILWTRLFIEFSFDKTVYIYSVIIVGFIFGLSLGSILVRKWINNFRDLPSVLGYIQLGIAFSSFILIMVFIYLSPVLVGNREPSESWLEISGKEYLIMFFIITIPVSLMGATFPVVGKVVSDNLQSLGSKIGVIGFLDTVGSIFGSFVAGFLMIPKFGIYWSFLIVVVMNLLLALLVFFFHPALKRKSIKVAVPAILLLSILIFSPGYSDYFKQRVRYFPGDKILSYAEGVSATVSVHELKSGHKALAINGAKTAFSTSADLKVHTLLAHVPSILSEDSRSAFVIGFGMGVTANCLSAYDYEKIDIAELSPEVVSTSAVYFRYLNENVLKNPVIKVFYEDGRSFLLGENQTYNVITSNAVHARLGANLYTTEFYEICLDKLSQGGVMCQWLPTNWLSENEFKSLIRSFIEVFPHSGLWYVTRGHMLLIGTVNESGLSMTDLTEKFKVPAIRQDLFEVGISNPEELLANFMAGPSELLQFTSDAGENTDNFPLVEFSLVTDLSPNYEILKQIGRMAYAPENYFDELPGNYLDRVRILNQELRREILFTVENYR
jgi:spermidine synthase